jgi:hypothetical protein
LLRRSRSNSIRSGRSCRGSLRLLHLLSERQLLLSMHGGRLLVFLTLCWTCDFVFDRSLGWTSYMFVFGILLGYIW